MTPLMFAVRDSRLVAAEKLIELGATIDDVAKVKIIYVLPSCYIPLAISHSLIS